MNEVMERLKHIPPWGYAAIAVGVLFLAFLTKNKSSAGSQIDNGTTQQIIAPVDPAAETASNDALWRMQELYNQLGSKYDQTVQNDASMQAGIDTLTQQIKDLKSAVPPPPTSVPTPIVVQVPTPAPAPAPAPAAPSGQWYTIKRGDTLSQIALDFYHTNPYNGNITKIANANGISNPNKIYAGSRIFIPA
jgi:LysM repeat protein